MIYINHVPGNAYEHFTSRNFGYSDAAEGFVMMSGIAAGLAYSAPFRQGFRWPAVGRVLRRVWTLYLVQCMVTLAALAILSFGAVFLGTDELLRRNDYGTFLVRPLGVHIGLPLLIYQIGYVNILPMYIVLLLMAPFMLWAGLRWPKRVWAVSGGIWYVAGQYNFNIPNYPMPGGWFFNPFCWQFLFCTGILIGIALKSGARFLPKTTWAQWATGLFLIFGVVTAVWGPASQMLGQTLWQLQEMGVPSQLTIFDKARLSLPRLLHIFALTYFLSTLPWVRRACESRIALPLVLLGRNALPVFVLGTLLGLASQVVKVAWEAHFALDSLLVLGGLALQLAFAWVLEKGRLEKPAKG
jgi:hypothetical protein